MRKYSSKICSSCYSKPWPIAGPHRSYAAATEDKITYSEETHDLLASVNLITISWMSTSCVNILHYRTLGFFLFDFDISNSFREKNLSRPGFWNTVISANPPKVDWMWTKNKVRYSYPDVSLKDTITIVKSALSAFLYCLICLILNLVFGVMIKKTLFVLEIITK